MLRPSRHDADAIRWWLVAPALALTVGLLVLLLRQGIAEKDASRRRPARNAPPGEAVPGAQKKPAADFPRLFEAGDSRVSRFLEANPDDPAAVLALAALRHDKDFLQSYKTQFRDDPVFALHYLCKFPDDPEFDAWIQVVLEKEPDNALGHYLQFGHLLRTGNLSEDEIRTRLLETTGWTSYEDHSLTIEEKAREFLTGYFGMEPLETARITARNGDFAPSPLGTIPADFWERGDRESPGTEDLQMAAAMYNIGTNFAFSDDAATKLVGLSIERLAYRTLEKGDALTFNLSPEEVRSQNAEDMKILRRMINAGAEEIDYLTEANVAEYLEIRRREGPVAAFLFVEAEAKAVSP